MRRRYVAIVMLCALPLSAQAQASFPVVDKATQRARDYDRHLILETELAAERADLIKAQALLARDPTDERKAAAHRHQENVNALLRELGQRPATGAHQPRVAQVPAQTAPQARIPPPAQAPTHAPPQAPAPRPAASGWDAPNAWDDSRQASDSPSSRRTREAQ